MAFVLYHFCIKSQSNQSLIFIFDLIELSKKKYLSFKIYDSIRQNSAQNVTERQTSTANCIVKIQVGS